MLDYVVLFGMLFLLSIPFTIMYWVANTLYSKGNYLLAYLFLNLGVTTLLIEIVVLIYTYETL